MERAVLQHSDENRQFTGYGLKDQIDESLECTWECEQVFQERVTTQEENVENSA